MLVLASPLAWLAAGPAHSQSPAGPTAQGTTLTAWYEARSNVGASGTAGVTWGCKAGGVCSAGTLTRQLDGSSAAAGTVTQTANGFNFNPVMRYTGRSFLGSTGGNNRDFITQASQGSAFGVGAVSDQLSFLGAWNGTLTACGTNLCNVGFRTTATDHSSSSAAMSNWRVAYNGTDGPTANVYGLWVQNDGTASEHQNVRNGWANGGNALDKMNFNTYVFRIGSFPGYSYAEGAAVADVSEVAYFNRKLTDTEAQIASSYFGIKYGVTQDTDGTRNNANNFTYLASNGATQVWSGANATYSGYHNNVFGLGRDDGTSLDQRIATNINNAGPVGTYALDILTMATGSLSAPAQFVYTLQSNAAGNGAGNGTALANGQYLMVGNNAGSTTAGTAATVANNTTASHFNGTWTRLNRQWRAQNTGGVGTVSLRFDVPAAGVTALGGNLNRVVLLVDNDGNYSNGGTRIVTTGRAVSGNQISFNVALANGEVFTLASTTATLILRKTTTGSVGGPFGFALTNTVQTTGTVSTTVANTATQVDGDTGTAGVQAFTIAAIGTALTIDESSLPAGWGLTDATCTLASSASVGSRSGTAYTIGGADVSAGAAITCTFTNTLVAGLTLQKTWANALANDAVTVSVTNPSGVGTPLNAVANTGSETDTGTPFTVIRGTTYTLTEAFTTGVAAEYARTLVCTGNTGTGAATSYTADALSGTVTIGSTATNVVCTFTNTRRITDVAIQKTATPNPALANGLVQFTMVVANNGPTAADGAVVNDPVIAGLDCTAAGLPAPTCSATSGAACPSPLTTTGLQAGLVIPTLPDTGTVTIGLTCRVTATGF